MVSYARLVPEPQPASWIDLDSAAGILGVHPRTLRRKISAGELPARRLGRLVRVNQDDVLALLQPIPTAEAS